MQSKTVKTAIIIFLAVLFAAGTFSGGLVVGWALPKHPDLSFLPQAPGGIPEVSTTPISGGNSTDLTTLFKPFWESWNLVHQYYVDQPVNDVNLMRGAISGMLAALGDQHTSYMDPDQYRQANMPLQGEYEGIGANVDPTGEYLVITSPMSGSPAEKAGLKPGDKIIAVDGQDMKGIDGNLVLRKVLGPAGTTVKLTILRNGVDQPFDVSIVRAKITLPDLESKMLDKNVAYIHLNTFGEKTGQNLQDALTTLLAQKPVGLVLDLRNNGGGFLQTAVDVLSQFIPKGETVMYEVKADGSRQTFVSKPGGLATDIPIVVLVNKGTASASEITAGAIQDYGRGTMVGETTYGKGSVQNWIALANDQGAVRITVARWITPKDRQINKVGLTPDFVVALTADDVTAGRDPQLEKAIEILTTPK
jgi:carboxyl-terminal processing protease